MTRFRTIEISDPQFEQDNLRFITVKSANLKGRGDIAVYVPPFINIEETLPVVILLHGVYGSAWSWAYKGGVHLRVNKLIAEGSLPRMILAMPSDGLWGDGSAYLPHNRFNFEKWIVEDVPEAIRTTITGAAIDSPLFIAGLSMGGFGALRIGAKYGHLFKGIAGHSSITSLPQIRLFVEENLINYAQDNVMDEDVFATMKQFRTKLPPIRFDCGKADLLINYNRELHTRLLAEGIPHTFEEFNGGHEWPYWSEHVIHSLQFFAEQLSLPTAEAQPRT